VLNELGFGNFGFYSLGWLYFIFGLACFFSTSIVKQCGERISLVIAALGYAMWSGTFILASMPIQYPELKEQWFMSDNFIKFINMAGASCCGLGAAVLWTAHGRYISTCASSKNQGLFNSIF